ncbi:MAG: ClpXP protease specificity-enhancing factor [Gammaproteobacteria bacterium]|nr:ClpXP protease specificity-enhancing factor [Gammaproteobacteria bacterium]
MTSSRPYLIRALYEWIRDNNATPYLWMNATMEGVVVPQQFVNEGQIVLNVSPSAVVGLDVDNEFLSFSARFSGRAMEVIAPIAAIQAIYARENGKGMVFAEETGDDDDPVSPPPPPPPPVKKSQLTKVASEKSVKSATTKRPQLKVVK